MIRKMRTILSSYDRIVTIIHQAKSSCPYLLACRLYYDTSKYIIVINLAYIGWTQDRLKTAANTNKRVYYLNSHQLPKLPSTLEPTRISSK